jgi:NAD(P)-dependent dehydrogenase (short-subunit alcohol dehydrogenase family)
VTGAHQGIGAAIARRLGRAGSGFLVACADIQDASQTARAIEGSGGHGQAQRLDVTDPDAWTRLVDSMLDEHGRIDVLGNVAGLLARGADTAADLSLDDWDLVTGVNLKGVWLGMRAVLPTMVAAGSGRIVNISSLAAFKGQPNLLAYSTTKGGVVAMTQQAAVEYAGSGVRINAIAPGVVDTPILGDMTAEMKATYADAHLIKRLATADEVAALFEYLVGPDASFITGHTYRLDGGASIS